MSFKNCDLKKSTSETQLIVYQEFMSCSEASQKQNNFFNPH